MGYFYNIFTGMLKLFKQKFLLLLHIIAAFLLPIKPLLLLVGLMIFLDTATGLWKARKTGEQITSHKLSRVISKMVLYQVGIITFFVLDKFLVGELIQNIFSTPFILTKIVALFFCAIELLSMNENIRVVTGNNFFRMFKAILIRAKEVKNDINDIVDDD